MLDLINTNFHSIYYAITLYHWFISLLHIIGVQDIGGKARRTETTRMTRCRWVDNIKIDLKERGWVGMDWTDLAQDRDE
jgi:hypothetical protein